jgi:hypothetical protein
MRLVTVQDTPAGTEKSNRLEMRRWFEAWKALRIELNLLSRLFD